MRFIAEGRKRFVVAAAAVLVVGGVGASVAATAGHSAAAKTPSNAVSKGRGVDEFGMTKSFYDGKQVSFTYSHGFYCDTKVKSAASSKCEAGAPAKKAPAKHYDPLFISVPLGFSVPAMKMECPTGPVCVDHPGTIDLSRLEPALKPLYPQLTDKQLTAALKNYPTPGHQHFITTKAGGKNEWWNVDVVGVTSKAEYNKINKHKSAAFLLKESKAGKTTGVIPTNLFLKFAVN